jgi:hypothetical protein
MVKLYKFRLKNRHSIRRLSYTKEQFIQMFHICQKINLYLYRKEASQMVRKFLSLVIPSILLVFCTSIAYASYSPIKIGPQIQNVIAVSQRRSLNRKRRLDLRRSGTKAIPRPSENKPSRIFTKWCRGHRSGPFWQLILQSKRIFMDDEPLPPTICLEVGDFLVNMLKKE